MLGIQKFERAVIAKPATTFARRAREAGIRRGLRDDTCLIRRPEVGMRAPRRATGGAGGRPLSQLVWILFALTLTLDVFGQTAFKLGLDRLGEDGGAAFWKAVARSPWITAGFLGYCVEAVAWMYVVGHAPLSVVGPMATLSYVGAVLSGRLFLGERPRARRWLAAGLVTIGAGLVGASLG
jgi:drug/metabolite transporter (DMT)-like permease